MDCEQCCKCQIQSRGRCVIKIGHSDQKNNFICNCICNLLHLCLHILNKEFTMKCFLNDFYSEEFLDALASLDLKLSVSNLPFFND